MGFYRTCCIILITLTITFFNGNAQDFDALPKLLPSYSEDFSKYNSYPSMCFEDVYFDKWGKLWLKVCGSVSGSSGLHLFQFNGYQFKLISGGLKQLDFKDRIGGIYKGEELVGLSTINDINQLFFFNLTTHEIKFQPIAQPGILGELLISDDDRIFFSIFENGTTLKLFEWKNGNLALQGQFDVTELRGVELDIPLVNTLYHDEDIYWAEVKRAGYFLRIDLKNGTAEKYYFSDLNKQSPITTEELVNATEDIKGQLVKSKKGEVLYVALPAKEGNNLFKWSKSTDQFTPVAFVPSNWEAKNIFHDKKENIIFLFKDKKNNYRAILENLDGERFDCSAIFKNYENIVITKLTSSDFNREIFSCSMKGMEVHAVKASEVIRHFLPSHAIRAMTELPGQQILITANDKHFIIDREKGSIVPYGNSDCPLGWTTFHRDDSGKIWTHDHKDIIEYDPVSNTCVKYPCQTENIRLFAFIDQEKIAIVDREESLFIHDLSTEQTMPFKIEGKPFKFPGYAQQMVIGNDGLLWVATSKGLWKMDLKNARHEIYGDAPPFETSQFLSMTKDADGRLWLGTTTHGVYIFDPGSGEVKNLKSENGLANNTVASILADDEGVFWIGTYNGISLVYKDGELMTNLNEEDGLVDRENNRYATFKDSDGKLWIGTVSGVNYIDPKKIKEKLLGEKDVKIFLNAINYFDEKNNRAIVQENNLNQQLKIVLPASQRFLNLDFSLSNYFKPEQNQFFYLLEGINDDWIFLSNQHQLNLNNLPAGKYNLLLKGRDAAGNWTSKPLVIPIHAKEYFYKQIWFYLLCLALLGGVAFLWIYRLRSEVRKATKTIRKDKETIEQQAEKLLELDEAKSRFFTNISHEFRTPLTIISGMADQIREKPDLWLERGIKMVKQNTLGLLNLVNQILDLRKLEANEMKVEMVNGNVVNYLRYILESHHSYVTQKGIQMHLLMGKEEIRMDYDPDKLLRIVTNLLSNAIKFTPDGGDIYLRVEERTMAGNPALWLQVQDTGVGIPEDDLPHIFGRFYQADDSSTRKREGTGIGLALVQELVKVLDGVITVESAVGRGAAFSITLPITQEAPPLPDDASGPLEAMIEPMLTGPEGEVILESADSEGKPSLLIVEDNPDVRQYLIVCLQEEYQLTLAENGRVGIDKAVELIPDLIVSDVMMPEKDGYELTEFLKNDERTDHIPIVLLTAKADFDSKMSGLEKGADAYLAKPFEKRELLLRLEKLLELRRKLQARYAQVSDASQVSDTSEVSDTLNPFLQKFHGLIEKEMSNAELDMEMLCRSLGMSRTQLFRKVKALTDQSPTVLIRSIRLQKGKELLATSDLTISEIAYEVGFTSLNYFSAAFFEEFGIRPSSFRK